jgi:hypothetical protein
VRTQLYLVLFSACFVLSLRGVRSQGASGASGQHTLADAVELDKGANYCMGMWGWTGEGGGVQMCAHFVAKREVGTIRQQFSYVGLSHAQSATRRMCQACYAFDTLTCMRPWTVPAAIVWCTFGFPAVPPLPMHLCVDCTCPSSSEALHCTCNAYILCSETIL